VLGTSLSGLNSDRVAKDPAKRSLQGRSLGTVIIDLQQTQQDGISSLNPGHNCQGSKQGSLMHIGGSEAIRYRGTVQRPGPGYGRVVTYNQTHQGWQLQVEGVPMLLGGWWLEAAVRGALEFVPVINYNPKVVDT